MNVADARALAEDALAVMMQMNASHEHVPSKARGEFAAIVIDLCGQLEAAQARIAELEAAAVDVASEAVSADPVAVMKGRRAK